MKWQILIFSSDPCFSPRSFHCTAQYCILSHNIAQYSPLLSNSARHCVLCEYFRGRQCPEIGMKPPFLTVICPVFAITPWHREIGDTCENWSGGTHLDTCLWLVKSDHVAWMLSSDWSGGTHIDQGRTNNISRHGSVSWRKLVLRRFVDSIRALLVSRLKKEAIKLIPLMYVNLLCISLTFFLTKLVYLNHQKRISFKHCFRRPLRLLASVFRLHPSS